MTEVRKKPRELPTYIRYKKLIQMHKDIYYASGNKEKYEHRYWVDSDTSWRSLDTYSRNLILETLSKKVERKEV